MINADFLAQKLSSFYWQSNRATVKASDLHRWKAVQSKAECQREKLLTAQDSKAVGSSAFSGSR